LQIPAGQGPSVAVRCLDIGQTNRVWK
jgi:hypothetical protein